MLGLKRGTVKLSSYNPNWPKLFEEEKKLLTDTFGDRIIAIEHIGSTAIPGVPAKPIIDINVAVASLNDIGVFIKELPKLGYEYIPERKFADRQFFPKGPAKARTHHLNLVEITSDTGWKNQLLFRDYLRNNKKAREDYVSLKKDLAQKYKNNRDEYTERKSSFIMTIIKKKAKYIVIFLLSGKAKREIDSLKKEISKRFGVGAALAYPPHITLKYPFETTDIKPLKDFLKKFSKESLKVRLRLRGFGCFDKEIPLKGITKSWNVHVEKSPELLSVRKQIIKKTHMLPNLTLNPKDEITRLYVTLAYSDISPQKFRKIGEFLKTKEFSQDILFDNITILMFKRKWVFYKKYSINY